MASLDPQILPRPPAHNPAQITCSTAENLDPDLSTSKKILGWGLGGVKWVIGIREGTSRDEHWMSYVRDESLDSTPEAKTTLYVN